MYTDVLTSGSSTGSYCHATLDSGTLQLLCMPALQLLSSKPLSQDASESRGSIALPLPLLLLLAAPSTSSVEGLRAADACSDVSSGDAPLAVGPAVGTLLLLLVLAAVLLVAAARAAFSAAELGEIARLPLLLLLPVVAVS
jgi:hypothetical protein